jgi:hypothetical protein
MEQDKRTIPHRQVGLQVVQPFINTGMSICGDRVITVAIFVYRMVAGFSRFDASFWFRARSSDMDLLTCCIEET